MFLFLFPGVRWVDSVNLEFKHQQVSLFLSVCADQPRTSLFLLLTTQFAALFFFLENHHRLWRLVALPPASLPRQPTHQFFLDRTGWMYTGWVWLQWVSVFFPSVFNLYFSREIHSDLHSHRYTSASHTVVVNSSFLPLHHFYHHVLGFFLFNRFSDT